MFGMTIIYYFCHNLLDKAYYVYGIKHDKNNGTNS